MAYDPLRVTNGSRIVDASTGLTKLDVVTYYRSVAAVAMRHYARRPVYIRRAPRGIDAPMVFQQHTLDMKGLKAMDPALWPGHEPAIAIEVPEDLPVAAQFDAIEFHTWNSVATAITQPDRIVFDLDPGADVGWAKLRDAARLVKTLLDELDLKAWIKTTGGKGLHLFVPIRPELGYPEVKAFSHAMVLHLANTLPTLFVSLSGGRNRVGRIFIDYLRNGWVQSTAESFTVRTRPGLGVSMPITWDELDDVAGPDAFNVRNAAAHVAGWKSDPWKAYWRAKQSLPAAMKRLGYDPAKAAKRS